MRDKMRRAIQAINVRHLGRGPRRRAEAFRAEDTPAYLMEALAADMANPTPDRSGEADKTGTGLAEGESGLPEGSSK